MPRILYAPDVDVMSVEMNESATSARTVEVAPGLNVDYDAQGRIIAIELLDASFHVDRAELERAATPSTKLSLAEAEAESGIRATTLRVQLNAGRLKGEKRGRDWVIELHDLYNYMESRSPRGRKPVSAAKKAPTKRAAKRVGGAR